ncbi:MAG: uroporphyrinogen-III synthase [Hyphomicrobiales bacterium]
MTRPQPDASISADRLRQLGHEVIVSSVLNVTFSNNPLSWHRDMGLVVTSRNGIRALSTLSTDEMRTNATLFTVGDATAALAKEAKFKNIISASGAVDDLVSLIADKKPARTLYICGRDRKGALDTKLQKRGIPIEIAERYHADFATSLTKEAINAFEKQTIDGVLHYSARSAEAFTLLMKQQIVSYSTKQITHFCLAKAISSVLDRNIGIHAVVAERPNEQSLCDAIDVYAKRYRN